MTILPLWPTQVWFPTALHLLAAPPVLLPRHPLVLPQTPTLTHPRAKGLVLAAMLLSGNPSLVKGYRQTLPDFYLNPGEQARGHNMGHISKTGCIFASAGKLILFDHL